MSSTPIVSVVIPTRNRPHLLLRAVRSALAQTLKDIEVVVVVDGPDPPTIQALEAIHDVRVTMIALPRSVGGADARNMGVQNSQGEFIALLDDDDEWSREKLALQLSAARACNQNFPVVTCRLIARRPIGDEIWPARQIRARESMSDYLLSRGNSFRQGEGFIQSSTLFFPRKLMLDVPFQSGLLRHQDWDWLIRVSVHQGVEFIWLWLPLVVYYIDSHRKSISSGQALQPSVDWVNGNPLITPRARAYFYATQVSVRCHTFGVLWSVVRKTLRYPRAFAIAMGLALVPRNLVYRLRPRRILNHA